MVRMLDMGLASFEASKILELWKSCSMVAMPASASPREKIPHPSAESLDLATIMRTLGDPLRLDVARLLAAEGPQTCTAIADALGLPTSTSSYHLRLLREAGVTRSRAEGTQRIISLRRDDLDDRFPGLVDVLTR
jgi:DNA-binding transcriptional ArsR family regulator